MKKHLLTALTLILALTLVLAGCSSGNNNGGGNNGGGETANDSGEKITLDVALWDENVKGTLDESIKIFNETYPNVEVKVTYTPWADYWSKLRTSLAGKSGPDVFWMNGPNIYMYADSGLLKDVQPMIDADGIDTSKYTKALVDLYTVNGSLYGLPYFLDSIGLFYNKELFDKASVAYPDDAWTWDTLKENAAKLTNKDEGVYGYIAPIGNQTGYYNLIHQAGGHILSDDRTTSGFGDPEALSAIQFMDDLMKQGISPNAQQQLEIEGMQLFGSGKAAMMPGISVNGPELHGMLGDKLSVVQLPAGKQKASIVHGLSWVMNNNTEHEKEAFELMKVFSGEQGQKLLGDSGFSIPALEGHSEGWVNSIPSLDLQVFVDSLKFGVAYPVSKNTAKWQDIEVKNIQDALLSKTSIEDALKTIDEGTEKVLAEEKEK